MYIQWITERIHCHIHIYPLWYPLISIVVSIDIHCDIHLSFIEGSLEVKLPTIWRDEKQSRAEAERRERLEERRSEKRKSQKKEDADARKGRKVAKHCVFPMICGPGGSKSRLAKAAGAEPAGQMRDEKVHAVVARSTCPSQNVQSTPLSDHFWKLRCQKSARRCGAKHISKSKCTKHTISGPLLEVEMSKKCTPLWREAHFEVKMHKTHHCRTTFGSWDVEKVHAVVARSTCPSQNVQSTPLSDHFWKLRCQKSARRCGAKHISKSKCTKHTISGPLLEVEMSKKCTPLWREAHFEVKMHKTHHCRTTFGSWDVEKVHAVLARSTCPSQNVQNAPRSDHFWKLRCRKSARRCGAKHISKSKCTKHTTFGPLLDIQSSFRVAVARDCAPCQKWAEREGFVALSTTTTTTPHYTPIHYNTTTTTTTPSLHSTTLHSTTPTTFHLTTLNCTQLHYTTLHYTPLHYTPLHYTTLHYTTLPSTTLHFTTLHCTTLHYTTLPSTTLHYTTLHYITLHTLHYIPLHSTTLHYITLHYITLNDTAPQIDR